MGRKWVVMPISGRTGLAAFLQTGSFTATITQEVELRTTDFGAAHDLDFLDTGALEQESPLHPDAVAGDTTHSKVCIVATPTPPDHHALKNLDTFTIGFNTADMHLGGITRSDFRVFAVRGFSDEGFQNSLHIDLHFSKKYARRRITIVFGECR